MVLNSFKELARIFGSKVKAEEKLGHGTYIVVEEACGRKAAVLWTVLQDREACRMYGEAGKIILTPAELAEITGYEVQSVIGSLMALIGKGFARLTENGNAVKAA